MKDPVLLTTSWQTIEAPVRVVSASRGELFLGTAAPAASDAGFPLVDNIPFYVHEDFTVIAVRGTGVARAA